MAKKLLGTAPSADEHAATKKYVDDNSGDANGPASSTDNAVARFDGTTGKLLQNSGVTISDSGGIATTIANSGNSIGLAITQNDTTNNLQAMTIVTSVARAALRITASVDIGADGHAPLYVDQSAAATSNNDDRAQVAYFRLNNASATARAVKVENKGTGRTLELKHTNDGTTLLIDRDVTNKANATSALSITNTSAVSDAATYTKTSVALNITSDVSESSGTITDTSIVVDINQTHTDASGTVVDIDNRGTGKSLVTRNAGGETFSITAAGALSVADASTTRTNLGLGTIATQAAPSGTVVGTSDTQTLTNKRKTWRVSSQASTSTLTPEIDTYDVFRLTAQAATLTIANHSTSTPTDGEQIRISIIDNGTARTISHGTNYVARGGTALPTTTTISKRSEMLYEWDANLSKYVLLAVAQEA